MTGRYLHKTGCHGGDISNKDAWGVPLTETFIPEFLHDAGYYNVMFGKWHLGCSSEDFLPNSRGFDHFQGFIGEGEDHYSHEEGDQYDWRYNDQIDYTYQDVFSAVAINTTIQTFLYGDGLQYQPWFMYLPMQV